MKWDNALNEMKLRIFFENSNKNRCLTFSFSVYIYESLTNVVWINFTTDSSVEYQGFSATWEILSLRNCSNQTLRNLHGRISSPGKTLSLKVNVFFCLLIVIIICCKTFIFYWRHFLKLKLTRAFFIKFF